MRKRERKQLRVMEETMMTKAGFGTRDGFRSSTTPLPSWKLYENPFYSARHCQPQKRHSSSRHHHPLPPISARKLAASLWDFGHLFQLEGSMEEEYYSSSPLEPSSSLSVSHRRRVSVVAQSDLDLARARIEDLKAEVDFERKLRKKAESLNKRLAKEVGEERKARAAMKRACGELANEIAADKAEIERMKKEMEEERKMLRLAQVWREERVQMKLTEAKLVMEEKIALLSKGYKKEDIHLLDHQTTHGFIIRNNTTQFHQVPTIKITSSKEEEVRAKTGEDDAEEENPGLTTTSVISRENPGSNNHNNKSRSEAEKENPHIMRGIKGFVEFPRVVRAVGSRSGRPSGSKVECQKAQLRLLLRQKTSGAGGLNVGSVLVG
ncbi:hypothetical protein H6P81_006023 [Aristolochia fimbriata]|uniref:Branchless trichome n=1 Tax=Aristolochia fimbriata TaxID=158543 RepID=A0AAV7EX85_ARIFI|nr:hypothetical protein H6P81_006023 [Aristolochia fimbriata]